MSTPARKPHPTRIVTPEQFKEGWVEFRRDEIPNIIKHQYQPIRKFPDGNYEVVDPGTRRQN